MAPSPEGLEHFAELLKNEFGETPTREQVEHYARALLNLYIAVYRTPLQVAEVQKLFDTD